MEHTISTVLFYLVDSLCAVSRGLRAPQRGVPTWTRMNLIMAGVKFVCCLPEGYGTAQDTNTKSDVNVLQLLSA